MKKTIKLIGIIVLAAVIGFSMSCGGDEGTGGSSGTGDGGDNNSGTDTLTFSGQVYDEIWGDDNTANHVPLTITYTASNKSLELTDSLSCGSGKIQNGQLSYTVGKPDASEINMSINDLFSRFRYSTITVNQSNVKCNLLDFICGHDSWFERRSYTLNKTDNETTLSMKFAYYLYVDKACNVKATGITFTDEDGVNNTLPNVNIDIKKGWNTLIVNAFAIEDNTSGKTTKMSFTSISIGDASSLKWVLL